MGNPLVLTLIRHGLTQYNDEKRYLGWLDLPLSEKGKKQLEKSRFASSKTKPALLITSDLKRTIETANILFPTQPCISLSKLREFHFGEWEGKTYELLKEEPLYQKWLMDYQTISPPKGETFQDFSERTNEAFIEVLNLAEKNNVTDITVVCHGGVIRQWLTEFAPRKQSFNEWLVPIHSRFQLEGNIDDLRRGLTFTSLLEEPIMAKIDGH